LGQDQIQAVPIRPLGLIYSYASSSADLNYYS